MAQALDPGHYFQTSDSIATSARKAKKSKNKHGDPIKLPSKILAAQTSVAKSGKTYLYIAEAAGEIKRVDFESGEISRIFSQSIAPLTCVALDASGNIYTGSWDKTIYCIPNPDNESQRSSSQKALDIKKLQSHTDFIKCLLPTTLNNHPILISGSADATIIIWDLSTSSPTYGKPLHKLKGHTKALQAFALDPFSSSEETPASPESETDSLTLFSASSDREIRRWKISLAAARELEPPILAHETSIYALRFDASGDLWTASADKAAKHLVRDRGWETDAALSHPDFVRDVLAFEELGLVVTACRDEEVRVWESGSGELVCTYSGHFEEVTALAEGLGGRDVVSVGIDGTVRRWSLERGEMARFRARLKEEADGNGGEAEGKGKGSVLTAEEEAELLELMDEDED